MLRVPFSLLLCSASFSLIAGSLMAGVANAAERPSEAFPLWSEGAPAALRQD